MCGQYSEDLTLTPVCLTFVWNIFCELSFDLCHQGEFVRCFDTGTSSPCLHQPFTVVLSCIFMLYQRGLVVVVHHILHVNISTLLIFPSF